MSRLFGLITKKEVDVSFILLKEGFGKGELPIKMKDGFGMGWYEEGIVRITRLPLPFGSRENDFWEMAETIHSRIVIFHIRESTVGDARIYNTHPFTFKNFMFAHMGTIENWEKIEALLEDEYRKSLKGETDSERFFMLLMQNWKDNSPAESVRKTVDEIEKVTDYTSLNFILTDGKKLYAFKKGRFPLFFLKRKPENDICCTSVSSHIAIRSSGLKGQEAVIVSAEQLSHEPWTELKDGEFLIVDQNLNQTVLNVK